MPKTIQRTVAFYWLRLRSREAVSYRPVEDVDWESRLADLDSMKWQEKAIDGIRYDAILGKEYPILSVSEQFDPTFMQYIDRENERVTDYMDNYLAGGKGRSGQIVGIRVLSRIRAHRKNQRLRRQKLRTAEKSA